MTRDGPSDISLFVEKGGENVLASEGSSGGGHWPVSQSVIAMAAEINQEYGFDTRGEREQFRS